MDHRKKPRRKRSFIWTIEKESLEKIVSESCSYAEIFRKLGIFSYGGNKHTLCKRLKIENISDSHISKGIDSNKGRKFGKSSKRIPDEILFSENSQKQRAMVRKRLISDGIIPYVCAECGSKSEWRNKPMPLILDHINGIPNDHRLENLRFLCPNCNSQTDTFCGKNLKYE